MKIEESTRKSSGPCFPKLVYTTTYEHLCHTNPNAAKTATCPQPTAAHEGAAVIAAWQSYNTIAATYCAAGNSACKNDKKCHASVSGQSSKKGAIKGKFTPSTSNPNLGKLECFLTIETSATIDCACA